MSPQYVELRPTIAAEIVSLVWTPCKFRRVSRLGSVTARLAGRVGSGRKKITVSGSGRVG